MWKCDRTIGKNSSTRWIAMNQDTFAIREPKKKTKQAAIRLAHYLNTKENDVILDYAS